MRRQSIRAERKSFEAKKIKEATDAAVAVLDKDAKERREEEEQERRCKIDTSKAKNEEAKQRLASAVATFLSIAQMHVRRNPLNTFWVELLESRFMLL